MKAAGQSSRLVVLPNPPPGKSKTTPGERRLDLLPCHADDTNPRVHTGDAAHMPPAPLPPPSAPVSKRSMCKKSQEELLKNIPRRHQAHTGSVIRNRIRSSMGSWSHHGCGIHEVKDRRPPWLLVWQLCGSGDDLHGFSYDSSADPVTGGRLPASLQASAARLGAREARGYGGARDWGRDDSLAGSQASGNDSFTVDGGRNRF